MGSVFNALVYPYPRIHVARAAVCAWSEPASWTRDRTCFHPGGCGLPQALAWRRGYRVV